VKLVSVNVCNHGDKSSKRVSTNKEDRVMKRITLTSLVAATLVLAASGDRIMLAGDNSEGPDNIFAACAKACAECTNSCASCYHHCVNLVSAGKSDHRKDLVLCNDCAEMCSTAAKLTSRQSPLSATACDGCAKACDECSAACTRFSQDRHMTDCAKACQDCAAACREMIKHLSR
jgi:hypothetical protein